MLLRHVKLLFWHKSEVEVHSNVMRLINHKSKAPHAAFLLSAATVSMFLVLPRFRCSKFKRGC